jgi:ATP-dependent Lhr-like helicase
MEDSFELLAERVKGNLKAFGMEKPSEVQQKAIPVILAGRNLLCIAPVGSGKTEAALLPVLSMLLQKQCTGLSVLYVTPLRALNRDLLLRMERWAEALQLRIAVRHGDTAAKERAEQLKQPPNVLITTPETLQAILPAPKFGEHLRSVRFVIIDEVHELCEDERGAQLSIALERLAQRAAFQRIGLSATVGEPEKAARFLCGKRQCEIINAAQQRAMEMCVESPSAGGSDATLAEKLALDAGAVARLRFLDALAQEHAPVLAFVNTRSIAETLSSRMRVLHDAERSGRSAGVHHGSLARDVRLAAESAFKAGKTDVLIATSSLELGIDIGSIEVVAQYLSPRQVGRLVQRVGRSGHRSWLTPRGVVIASDAEDCMEAMVVARRACSGLLESTAVQSNALDVLAHQLAGIAMDLKRCSVEQALRITAAAYPFEGITESQLRRVLSQLASERLIWLEANAFGRNRNTFAYYFENLSMIPDERKYIVRNAVTNADISLLDERFVASYVEPRSVFITKGVPWQVIDVAEREIIVEPSADITAAIPDWEGEEIPVPFAVAQEVGALRARIARKLAKKEGFGDVAAEYRASGSAMRKAVALIAAQAKSVLPDDKTILVEATGSIAVINACVGSRANEALGRALSALLVSAAGASVRMKADAYRIVFELPGEADAARIERMLRGFAPEHLRSVLERSLLGSSLFRYKFMQVAKKFGFVSKSADVRMSIKRLVEAAKDTPLRDEALREIYCDYLDVEACEDILRKIRSAEMRVVSLRSAEPTPISNAGIMRALSTPELLAPAEPTREIVEAFKAHITGKRIKLFCTHCFATQHAKIAELPDAPRCSACGSPLVAAVREEDALARKMKQGKTLSADEAKQLRELKTVAGLVETHGKRAITALATYGVGAKTAARILRRLQRDERAFFAELLEAQKTFIRTKRFWG